VDLVALKAELDTDPRSLGYAGKTIHQLKPMLNTNPEVVSRPISPQQLWQHLFDESRWVAMVAAQTDVANTLEERNAATALVQAAGGHVVDAETREQLAQSIVLTSAPFVNAVELVEDAGVLSVEQGAAVLALGNVSLPRDEAIGLGHVREAYITAALAL